MKERITITIEETVLSKELKQRKKGVSRSQHIEDMMVAQMAQKEEKKKKGDS